MGLGGNDRQALLSRWIKPSSDSEQDRQDRAQRMILDAINTHSPFSGASVSVYAKGSYANNTNVRLDSDVDIVVQCAEVLYYDYAQGVTPPAVALPSYGGIWTAERWRREVAAALIGAFGLSSIDPSGNVALTVAEKPGSRPSTDVVPSFDYSLFWSSDGSQLAKGSAVVPKNGGPKIVNWPEQQLDNGRAKNATTGRRYKNIVRALKNAENQLVADGQGPKPSYLMECLVYNCSNATLANGSLDDAFRATLADLWQGLTSNAHHEWVEPNGIKYLFRAGQKWTADDAKEVIAGTWKMLYGT